MRRGLRGRYAAPLFVPGTPMDGFREQALRSLAGRRRVGWRRSLRTRLMLWSTLTSVLLTAGVALVAYLGMRDLLQENVRDEVRGLAQQTTRGLQATLDSVQVSGAALASNAAGIGRDPLTLRTLLVSTVAADPDIFGAMLVIEPGRLSPDDPGFSWYVRRGVDGLHEGSVTDLGVDYRIAPWYVRTVTQPDASWWSEPNRDNSFGGGALTTYYLPLRPMGTDGQPGAPVGLVALDVPLARLRAQLGDVPEDYNLRAMLMSPERRYVLHPDPEIQMQATLDSLVADGGRSDLVPFLHAVQKRERIELDHVIAADSNGAPAGERRFSIGLPVADTGWTFVLSASDGYVLERLNEIARWVVLAGLLGVLLGVVLIRRTAGLIAAPIEELSTAADHIAKGEYDQPIGHADREDEVGVLARSVDTARQSIRTQLREIADMGAARSRLESELAIAGEIQQAMLPRASEFDAGDSHLELFGHLVPATTVGGDFYNFFERDGDALWFVIGDVSDKGVPAAVFMARTMTVLEVAAQTGGSPGHALREAARHLLEGNDTCMFATVLCGVIELRTGMVSLASAGHEPPVLLRADGRRELLKVPTAGPLGVDVADVYPAWRGRLRPGDTLFTYTDGITEAFDRDQQPFGEERLLALLDPAANPQAQCDRVIAGVHAFAGDAAQSDDITVLALRYKRDARRRPRASVKAALHTPLPPDPVRVLIAEVDAGLGVAQLPATLVHDLHLVIEEVATNVLGHGADDGRVPTLEVEAHLDGRALSMEFRDDGQPFDPLSLPAPDLECDIADRPIGGLGVHLVRELAEHIAYTREHDHNVLRVVLPLPPMEPFA